MSVRCAIMLISVLVACLPFSACAQCYWGEIELKKAESPRTVNTLFSWEYEPENIITAKNKIWKAAIREDKLLVYFSAINNNHPFINVYDLNGCYLYGYSITFDKQSGGVHLLHMYNGDPLLYCSLSNCIYRLTDTGASVYDAPDLETVRQADYRNSQTTRIGECTDSKLTLIDEDGNEITVIDYTAEHAEIYPNTPLIQFGRLVSLFAFIAFCIFAISKFSDD